MVHVGILLEDVSFRLRKMVNLICVTTGRELAGKENFKYRAL